MKYLKYSPLALLIVILIMAIVPNIIEKQFNTLKEQQVFVNNQVQEFHKSLFIADLHSDSLMWARNINKRYYRGHLDIPRLDLAGFNLQIFSVVTKVPRGLNIHQNPSHSDSFGLLAFLQKWPYKTWLSPTDRAKYQANKLHSALRQNTKLKLLKYKEDIEQSQYDKSLLVGLSLEGVHALTGDLEQTLKDFDQLGFRIFGLAHFFDNQYAGSAHGIKKHGLSDKGWELIKHLKEKSFIVDLAHSSEKTIEDVLNHAGLAIMVSHTGIRGHCNNPRNISDKHAKQIAARGGIIGIGFWPTAVCGNDIDAIVAAIHYAVNLLGDNHVALGSDFDGAVQVPFTADKLVYLTQRLLDSGFNKRTVKKIMGENVKSFFKQKLPNAPAAKQID